MSMSGGSPQGSGLEGFASCFELSAPALDWSSGVRDMGGSPILGVRTAFGGPYNWVRKVLYWDPLV